MSNPDSDHKLRTPEAAAYIGCSPRTLEKFRQTGGGPVYLKVGRSVLYLRSDLDLYLEQCRRASTSDPGPEAVHHD